MLSWVMPGTSSPQITLIGWSKAAIGTGFHIPELKWALDAGITGLPASDRVFVTHGHLDHSLVLPASVGTYGFTKVPTQVYCPAAVEGLVASYVHLGLQLNVAGVQRVR